MHARCHLALRIAMCTVPSFLFISPASLQPALHWSHTAVQRRQGVCAVLPYQRYLTHVSTALPSLT